MQDYDTTTALVIVDLQNDFADPAGGLTVLGGDAIVGTVNNHVAIAVDAGATVVATQDWHPESTPHFARDGGIWPVHCIADTWGAELHPRLVLPAATAVVRKGTSGEDGYSGFTMRDSVTGEEIPTVLDHLLRESGVRRIVVVGIATDYCVKATAMDGLRLGYETSLIVDAVAAVDLVPGDGDRALAEMQEAGVRLLWASGERGA